MQRSPKEDVGTSSDLARAALLGRLFLRIQRRAEEFDAPFCPERVQGRSIRNAVSHCCGKLRGESCSVKGWRYENILAGGGISHVDKAIRCAGRNADDVTRLGKEVVAVDLVEVASLDDAKDFRFPVAMLRRSLSGRVDGFDEAELASAGGRG